MISTARIFGAVLALTIVVAQPAPAALAQSAPFCAPGTEPRFSNGFAALKTSLGPVMGEAVECEHNDDDNNVAKGDAEARRRILDDRRVFVLCE